MPFFLATRLKAACHALGLDESGKEKAVLVEKLVNGGPRMTKLQDLVGQRVRVYCNLHRKVFSVLRKGKVVAHLPAIRLRDVEFLVSEAGRRRVVVTRRKNVHAYVEGEVVDDGAPKQLLQPVNYNPFRYAAFTRISSDDGKPWPGSEIYKADIAVLLIDRPPCIFVVENTTESSLISSTRSNLIGTA